MGPCHTRLCERGRTQYTQKLNSTAEMTQLAKKPNWIGESLGQEKTNLRCGHRTTQAHGKMRGTQKIQREIFSIATNQNYK
jgi:hypothetical protein